jgi:hypothetical protein
LASFRPKPGIFLSILKRCRTHGAGSKDQNWTFLASTFIIQHFSFKIPLCPLRNLRDLCGKKTETLPVKNIPQPFWRTRIFTIGANPAKS